jgi:hypothetical protein
MDLKSRTVKPVSSFGFCAICDELAFLFDQAHKTNANLKQLFFSKYVFCG